MKKARIFLGLLLIMALMAFSGCGTNNTDIIDPDTPDTVTDSGINDDNDDGILDGDDDDNDILDDDNDDGILDDDNNDNNPLDAKTTTDSSIGNKDNTTNNQ